MSGGKLDPVRVEDPQMRRAFEAQRREVARLQSVVSALEKRVAALEKRGQ